MSLTRANIKTLVQGYTGKSNKDTLIETLCNLALNEAVRRHPFADSRSFASVASVVGETSIALPATLVNIISIEVVDDDDVSTLVALKPAWWWAKHAGSNANAGNGRPQYANKQGSNLVFSCGFDEIYTVRIGYSYYPTFALDTTECPIPVLETFVVNYVTAHVFLSIEEKENFAVWMSKAVGGDFNDWRGGEFAEAVSADKDQYAMESSAGDVALRVSEKPVFFTEDGRSWFRPY